MVNIDSETNIKYNPFWLEAVRQFVVLKFELNPKNKDLYFWVVDSSHFSDDEIVSEDDDIEVKEEKLKNLDDKKLVSNEILVRVVGADYKDSGVMRKYIGGTLFYEFREKKWNMIARLSVLKYAQDKNKHDRRFRLSKPSSKVGMFDEVVGEKIWDDKSKDFKPGLVAYHEERHRDYKEYAGILGSIMLFSETKIIQNESIRYPVTHLNNLLEISFDLLNAHSSGSKISAEYTPK